MTSQLAEKGTKPRFYRSTSLAGAEARVESEALGPDKSGPCYKAISGGIFQQSCSVMPTNFEEPVGLRGNLSACQENATHSSHRRFAPRRGLTPIMASLRKSAANSLLHRPRLAVLQAVVDDGVHFAVGFLRKAALFFAQAALLLAQLALFLAQLALLLA
jgi:methylphosphotriester-DNA--protein-cysteine methyltransferase